MGQHGSVEQQRRYKMWAGSLSSTSLGSHPSYGSLKTIARQVEQLGQRITDEAEVDLKAEGSSEVQMQQQRERFQHKGLM